MHSPSMGWLSTEHEMVAGQINPLSGCSTWRKSHSSELLWNFPRFPVHLLSFSVDSVIFFPCCHGCMPSQEMQAFVHQHLLSMLSPFSQHLKDLNDDLEAFWVPDLSPMSPMNFGCVFFLVDTNERKLRDFWIFAWPEIYLDDFLLKYRAACVWFVFWGSQAHLGFESRRSRFWQGSLNANHFGGIKHCKCMVWNLCPVWVGVILGAPVFWSPNQAQALRSEMEKKSDQLKHTNTLVKCFCQQRLGFFFGQQKDTKISRSHPNARLSRWFSFSESGICYRVHEMYALYLQNIQCHSGQIVRWIAHRIWWGVLTSEYSHKDNGLYSMALCKHVETLMHRYSSLYAWLAFSSVLQICFCMDFSKCLRLHRKT